MYLYILNDGRIGQSSLEPSENDKAASRSGYVTIIKISDPGVAPLFQELTDNGEWVEVSGMVRNINSLTVFAE